MAENWVFLIQNYRGKLNHMNAAEFVQEFEDEHQGLFLLFSYPNLWKTPVVMALVGYCILWFDNAFCTAVKWLDIHQRIRNIIRSVFDSAAIMHPEMHSPFSRAVYGVDVMLDCWFMPKILEVQLPYVLFFFLATFYCSKKKYLYSPVI